MKKIKRRDRAAKKYYAMPSVEMNFLYFFSTPEQRTQLLSLYWITTLRWTLYKSDKPTWLADKSICYLLLKTGKDIT